MKFRTDFVTNSSSSSFVTVNIKIRGYSERCLFNRELSVFSDFIDASNTPYIDDYGVLRVGDNQISTVDQLLSYLSWLPEQFKSAWSVENPIFNGDVLADSGFFSRFKLSNIEKVTVTDHFEGNSGELNPEWELCKPYAAGKPVGDFISQCYRKYKKYKDVYIEGNVLHVPEEGLTLHLSAEDSNTCRILGEFILKCLSVDFYKHESTSVESSTVTAMLETGKLPEPDSVGIEFGYLYNNSEIININFARYGKTNGKALFKDLINKEKVVIPENISDIPDNSFRGCTKMESLYVPACVTRIGKNAFEGCDNLSEMTIASKSTFDHAPFANLTNLKTVIFSDGVERIGKNMFTNCPKLSTVTFPSSIKIIYESAFHDCDSFQTVIPDNVAFISEPMVEKLLQCCEQDYSLVYKALAVAGNVQSVEKILHICLTEYERNSIENRICKLIKAEKGRNNLAEKIVQFSSTSKVNSCLNELIPPSVMVKMELRFNIWLLIRLGISYEEINGITTASSATIAELSKLNQIERDALNDVEAIIPKLIDAENEEDISATKKANINRENIYYHDEFPTDIFSAISLLKNADDVVHMLEDIYTPAELKVITNKYARAQSLDVSMEKSALKLLAEDIVSEQSNNVELSQSIICGPMLERGNKRLLATKCLLEGLVYIEITDGFGISTSTIRKMSRTLNYNNNGGITALIKACEEL